MMLPGIFLYLVIGLILAIVLDPQQSLSTTDWVTMWPLAVLSIVMDKIDSVRQRVRKRR